MDDFIFVAKCSLHPDRVRAHWYKRDYDSTIDDYSPVDTPYASTDDLTEAEVDHIQASDNVMLEADIWAWHSGKSDDRLDLKEDMEHLMWLPINVLLDEGDDVAIDYDPADAASY